MEHIIVRRARNRRDGALQRQRSICGFRAIRDATNPFADPNFRAIYRITPDMALNLIEELRPHLPATKIANAIPIEIKVLSALHFYGQGSYQKSDGRDACISLSQASVSRAIRQTTMALNTPQILGKWIKFPANAIERQQVIQKNYRQYHMPGVLGYVDGTHILLKKPAVHEELYINRKGQHSLNVQMVCDSDLIILNVLAKYPGSTHDAFIWRTSSVKDKMVEVSRRAPCWLLSDSGYPLEPWLLTPILNAEPNSPEARYTERHIRSRNCIERCFGVLKGRFRCLHKHCVLEYTPTTAGCITNACAVLHNMCVRAGLEEPELELDDPGPIEPSMDSRDADLHQRGLQVRADIINRLN